MQMLKIIASVVVITTIIQLNSIASVLAIDTDEVENELNNRITTGSAVSLNVTTEGAADIILDDEVVEIKDSTLQSIVREKLGKKVGNITKADMLKIRSLNISDKVIHSLSGLEYATNMTGITAKNCTIEGDMSPLSKINKSSDISAYISFHNCDIDSLNGLPTNLTSITLYRCKIKDGKFPLECQTNLRIISIVGCGISDITSLKDSTNLEYVRLAENNITDINVLGNMYKIVSLDLFKNNVSDISPIKNLTNLSELHLEHNNISDITPLSSLKKLVYLNLSNDSVSEPDNKVTDITALRDTLSNCSSLYLYLNKIPNYNALEGIGNNPLYQNTKYNVLEGNLNMATIHGTAWLTVRYVDENDIDISKQLIRNINFKGNINFKITNKYSDACTAKARKINGYKLIDDEIKSVEFDKDSLMKTLVFHYKKDSISIDPPKEKPKKEKDKKKDNQINDVEITEPIKDEPIITPEEIIIPEEIIGKITVRYVDDNENDIGEPKTLENLKLGEYTEEAKEFNNYRLNDENIKTVILTKDEKEQIIEFKYKKIIPKVTRLPQTGEKNNNIYFMSSLVLILSILILGLKRKES